MRIVLVTNNSGRILLENLRKIFSSLIPRDIDIEYRTVDSPLISFSSRVVLESIVRKILEKEKPDLIVLPYDYRKRTSSHNVVVLDGTVVLEGPKHIADVIPLLMFLSENSVNSLVEKLKECDFDLYEVLKEYKRKFESYILRNVSNLSKIRRVFGRGCRVVVYEYYPRVLAEIIDATYRSVDECVKIASYYIESGADIVDVGCVAGDPRPWKVREIIYAIRKELGEVPVSVDTFADSELITALESGADLLLSFTLSKLQNWHARLDDVGVVIVPESVPDSTGLITYFKSCVDAVRKLGGEPILDPLLTPPLYGFSDSIARLVLIRREFPDELMLIGAGNVTELVDADSVGVNMLLAVIAVEQQVDFVLTTEASVKCRGAVSELRRGIDMCYVSKILGKCPKDLSFNMLVSKRKK